MVHEGLIWTAGEPGGEEDFGPLYDFGTPDYGCVEIQYREGDRWVRCRGDPCTVDQSGRSG